MAVAIEPGLVGFESLHVAVEAEGRLTRGMTVADLRDIEPYRKEPPRAGPPSAWTARDSCTSSWSACAPRLRDRLRQRGLHGGPSPAAESRRDRLGRYLARESGGKGANQAVAARRLGGEVRLIGCVGDDADGRRIKESLAAAGIGVAGLCATADAATGTAIIMVDAQGRNQIAVAPGANHRLTVEMVEAYAESIAWAEVVACQLETPLPVVRWALGEARRHGVITVLNPAPVQPLDEDLLALVDYLTPNEHEAGSLTDRIVNSLESAGRRRRGSSPTAPAWCW